MLESREETKYFYGFVVVDPRHSVAGAAVQAGVAGQQAERDPSLVEVGRGKALEVFSDAAPGWRNLQASLPLQFPYHEVTAQG